MTPSSRRGAPTVARVAFAVSLCALAPVRAARAAGPPASNVAAPAAPATPSKPSPLEPIREAQRRFAMGVTLYEEGDLKGALAEFRRAHQIFPSYKVLYNLGTVSRELYDWAAALGYFRDYLHDGGEAIPVERRLLIERQVLELAQRVGHLEVVVRDGPAEVLIDEQPAAPRPQETAVLVNPGKRRLKVSYPGRPPVVKLLDVASGDRTRVVIDRPNTVLKTTKSLPPVPVTAVALAEAPPAEAPAAPAAAAPSGGNRAVWWCWGATGLLGAGALTLGLTARQSGQLLATERTRFPANPGNLSEMAGRTRNLALAADALAVATVVLAAISTYVGLSGPARVGSERVALAWTF